MRERTTVTLPAARARRSNEKTRLTDYRVSFREAARRSFRTAFTARDTPTDQTAGSGVKFRWISSSTSHARGLTRFGLSWRSSAASATCAGEGMVPIARRTRIDAPQFLDGGNC
jgi:hypothetical protein